MKNGRKYECKSHVKHHQAGDEGSIPLFHSFSDIEPPRGEKWVTLININLNISCIHKTNKNRPLYRAFQKYGIENFSIETIEETNNPNEREKYWIEYYGSFKNGYNATIGGDGKPYIDYDLVVATYKEIMNMEKVAEKLVKRFIIQQTIFLIF